MLDPNTGTHRTPGTSFVQLKPNSWITISISLTVYTVQCTSNSRVLFICVIYSLWESIRPRWLSKHKSFLEKTYLISKWKKKIEFDILLKKRLNGSVRLSQLNPTPPKKNLPCKKYYLYFTSIYYQRKTDFTVSFSNRHRKIRILGLGLSVFDIFWVGYVD